MNQAVEVEQEDLVEPFDSEEVLDKPVDQAEADAQGDEPEEVSISIGDEAPAEEDAQPAAAWVRELRTTNRDLKRKLKEAEQKLQAPASAEPTIQVGAKPTLADLDYDTEKFSSELEAWHERKLKADEQAAKRQRDQEAQQTAWQAKQTAYGKLKSELKVRDADEAEAMATDMLSVTQQGVILQGAENAARLIYAMGKNPKKCQELAAITDPVQFAFAAAKLETQLKITPRKTAPLPERSIRGNANISGAVDSQLDKLRAEADKTGDRTKVVAYMRRQRDAARH